MEAICSSETSGCLRSTRRHNPEDSNSSLKSLASFELCVQHRTDSFPDRHQRFGETCCLRLQSLGVWLESEDVSWLLHKESLSDFRFSWRYHDMTTLCRLVNRFGKSETNIWIERVAANILNKRSRTADKGWSSSLGVGLKTPHRKTYACYENSQEASDMH
jgi:hypothetical protein